MKLVVLNKKLFEIVSSNLVGSVSQLYDLF
jgi:hypothetical protein